MHSEACIGCTNIMIFVHTLDIGSEGFEEGENDHGVLQTLNFMAENDQYCTNVVFVDAERSWNLHEA